MELDNKELIAKAKHAATPEELLKLAKENGTELTEESAQSYFELLHPKSGEISDDELDNVAGGGCYKKGDGRLITTVGNICKSWRCKDDGSKYVRSEAVGLGICYICSKCKKWGSCRTCKFCSYEKGLWLCNNPDKMKK